MTKQTILNLIRFFGPISRVAIAEKLEISNTAVTNYITELLSEGIILENRHRKIEWRAETNLDEISIPTLGILSGLILVKAFLE